MSINIRYKTLLIRLKYGILIYVVVYPLSIRRELSMSMVEINGVKVNQIKERFLRRFLEAVEKEKHVQRVYLFGSVLEERCTEV